MRENDILAIEKEGIRLIQFYSYSLLKMFQTDLYAGMMEDWKKASMLLHRYTIENDSKRSFPLSFDEQIDLIKKPVNSWGIGFFDDFEGINIPLIQNNDDEWIASELAIELAKQYDKNPGAIILEKMKDVVREAELDNRIYTKLREMFIRNPVISEKDIIRIEREFEGLVTEEAEFALEQVFGTSNLTTIFESQYKEIPLNELTENKLELCPYCGYTLKTKTKRNFAGLRDKHYFCLMPKCLRRRDVNERRIIETKKGIPYFRLKNQIMYSVVHPGIIEIELYDRLTEEGNSEFEVQLYPGADKADLLVRFKNGFDWAIDAKDWVNPNALANSLNARGFMKGVFSHPGLDIKSAFLVLPNDASDTYINVIRAKWEKSNQHRIIRLSDLIKKIQERDFT